MICVKTNKILRGEIEERIVRWAVWFRTPFGLCKSLAEANKVLTEHEIDPSFAIVPVAVAEGSTTHEAWDR